CGPSTGLPTKTEASDRMMAMYGRHGESPWPIVSASTPADCFFAAIEASRLAIKYRTPVILLTDGYLANGSEPWLLPDVDSLPDISVSFATEPNAIDANGEPQFLPYKRDDDTLARPWAIPGTPGLEHRVGGIEKENETGNVNYDPTNHGLMTDLRQAKIQGIAKDIPLIDVEGPGDADVLLVGWGSTRGAITSAADRLRADGLQIDTAHLTHLHPFASNLGEILSNRKHVFVPELNKGQLVKLLRAEFLVDAKPINKVEGTPFTAGELVDAIREGLK
ncbi:MAG: 2-oxoacid:acceptor oxidoreductase subunit alpha, partial [Acidimicrobiales bacterium]